MAWVSSAADVFSAVGTVGSLGVAMFLLRKQLQREATRDEADRRAQAARVSAWLETRTTPQGGRDLLFHVHNASDMPIYEVSLPSLMPGDSPEDQEAEFIGLVPPGQTIMRSAPRAWLKTYFTPEPVPIEFLDSAGQAWARDEQGALVIRGG